MGIQECLDINDLGLGHVSSPYLYHPSRRAPWSGFRYALASFRRGPLHAVCGLSLEELRLRRAFRSFLNADVEAIYFFAATLRLGDQGLPPVCRHLRQHRIILFRVLVTKINARDEMFQHAAREDGDIDMTEPAACRRATEARKLPFRKGWVS